MTNFSKSLPSDRKSLRDLSAYLSGIVVAALLVVGTTGPEVTVTDGHLNLLTIVGPRVGPPGSLRTHGLGLELVGGTDGATVGAAVALTRRRLAPRLGHHRTFLDVSHLVLNLLHNLSERNVKTFLYSMFETHS